MERVMKDKSLKKIILTSIGLISSILMIIGLAIKVICFKALQGGVSGGAGILYETGFSLIDFNSLLLKSADYNEFAFIMGILVIGILAVSVSFLVYNIFSLFKNGRDKCYKKIKLTLTLNTILSAIYFIVGLLMVVLINSYIKSGLGNDVSVDALLFKTSSFVPLIFQVVMIIAYVICTKTIKERVGETSHVKATATFEKAKQETFLEREKRKIDLVIKYRNLYSENIISILEFERKKQILLFQEGAVDLEYEEQAIQIVKEYDKIYKEGIIKADELEKKKLSILFKQ